MKENQPRDLKIFAVVSRHWGATLQCRCCNNHVCDAARVAPTPECRFQVSGPLCDCGGYWNPFDARKKGLRGLFLAEAKTANNLRDANRRGGQFLPGGNKPCKQSASLFTVPERVNQNGRVEDDLRGLAHSGSRFSSRPASLTLGSLRKERTQPAVPSSTSSG